MSTQFVEELQDAVADLIVIERQRLNADIGDVRKGQERTVDELTLLKTTVEKHVESDRSSELEQQVDKVSEWVKALQDGREEARAEIIRVREGHDRTVDELMQLKTSIQEHVDSDQSTDLEQQVNSLSERVEKWHDAAAELIDVERERVNVEIIDVRKEHDGTVDELMQLKTSIQEHVESDQSTELEQQVVKLYDEVTTVKNDISALLVRADKIKKEALDGIDEKYNRAIEAIADVANDTANCVSGEEFNKRTKQLENISERVEQTELALEQSLSAISEERTRIEADLDRRFDQVSEKLATDLQFARVDANLWKEQAKNQLRDLDTKLDKSHEMVDVLDNELMSNLEDIDALVTECKKAVDEKTRHLGGYKKGQTYTYGQCVCRDGATFFCVADKTTVDPREKTDTPNWRLLAAKGERGEKGEAGRSGTRGEKGEIGKAGKDGISFVGAEISGSAIVLVSTDGTTHRLDIEKTVNDMIDARLAIQSDQVKATQ